MGTQHTSSGFTLYAHKGYGSALPEALLTFAGVDFERVEVDFDGTGEGLPEAELRLINPLGQVPVLTFPDGTTLTESVALVYALAEEFPATVGRLVPPLGSSARKQFYRWMSFCAFNIYAAINCGDAPERWCPLPEAQAGFKEQTALITKLNWQVMEESLQPAPFLLGAEMSALDMFVAMLSRWRPGRTWFELQCPKLASAVRRTEGHPVVAKVWARNLFAASTLA